MEYVIEFEIAAVFMQVLLIVMYKVRHNEICERNNFFESLLILGLTCTISNIISVYTLAELDKIPLWINYFVNVIYFITFNFSSIAVFNYIINVIGSRKLINKGKRISYVYISIMSVLIFPTPWTGWVFSIKNGTYGHGFGIIILYALSVSLLVMIFIIIFRHKREIDRLQFWVLIVMNLITISAIAIQAVYQNLLLQNFAISLSYCMLYIALQNPDDYMDKFTGCRNRKSFYRVMDDLSQKQISLVGFVLEDYTHTQAAVGYEGSDKLLNVISVFLIQKFGKERVYHVDDGEYIILLSEKMSSDVVIDVIDNFFAKPIRFEGWDWKFFPHFFEMKNQKLLADEVKDIFERVSFQLENDKNQKKFYIDEKYIKEIREEKKIVRQMKKAVEDKKFEVYYQPIFHTMNEKFCSAEALLRFFDEDGNMVSPDYFIPLAERNGMILEIGEIVIEKVCQFIKEQKTANHFKYIEINLSMVQCMREDLPEIIKHYTKQYQINPDRLNFEITETAEIINEKILMQNMKNLCDEGYSFSLDDFGTGYSTALYLSHMPVEIVKIDKSILWSAMKNDQAMKILENMVNMIKSLKKKIVVEGIETEQMAEVLKTLGCDYLQGFFYSKPLPEKELQVFLQ